MKFLRRIAALLAGFVFFAAGFLKLMDPVGAGLVVEEYFKFLHLAFLTPVSKVVAVGAALLETFVGAALITGVWKKVTALVTLALTAFFTLLTLVILIFNPPMDCGCFGQAVHLTHAQTFLKNIVLLALWALAFLPLSRLEPAPKIKTVSFAIAVISVVVFTVLSLLGVPMADFTPFAPGEDVSGQLSLSDSGGEYCDSLALQGRVMVISEYNPERRPGDADRFLSDAAASGFRTLELAAAIPEEGEDFYFADRRTLMTLNRSNGGATYLDGGRVICKWPARSLPDAEKLAVLRDETSTEALLSASSSSRVRVQGFLLYVFAVMLLL